jgi:hypothetical protein
VAGSGGTQRFGGRQPGGAQRGEQAGDGADGDGGADAAAPGERRDDDRPVLGAGVDGGGEERRQEQAVQRGLGVSAGDKGV